MDCKETLWELFNKTGNIRYYIMWCALDKEDKQSKR